MSLAKAAFYYHMTKLEAKNIISSRHSVVDYWLHDGGIVGRFAEKTRNFSSVNNN